MSGQSLVKIRLSEFQHRQWSRRLLAQERGADYLGVGAVFPTSSKDDAVEVDHEMVKAICEAVDIPVIAIGGITKDNVQESVRLWTLWNRSYQRYFRKTGY